MLRFQVFYQQSDPSRLTLGAFRGRQPATRVCPTVGVRFRPTTSPIDPAPPTVPELLGRRGPRRRRRVLELLQPLVQLLQVPEALLPLGLLPVRHLLEALHFVSTLQPLGRRFVIETRKRRLVIFGLSSTEPGALCWDTVNGWKWTRRFEGDRWWGAACDARWRFREVRFGKVWAFGNGNNHFIRENVASSLVFHSYIFRDCEILK